MRRVVVTGIGSVGPLGNRFSEAWQRMRAGVSGIGTATTCDGAGSPWVLAGEVTGFSAYAFMSARDVQRLDLFVHFAAAASLMAADDAGLIQLVGADSTGVPACEILSPRLQEAGVVIGSSRGGITTLEREIARCCGAAGQTRRRGRPRVSPSLMPGSTVSMAASYSAQRLGVRGLCLGISNACASGANAVGEAYRMIRAGRSDLLLAGGAEAPLCRIGLLAFGSAGALSRAPRPPGSRPFDRRRDGFVLAEGATVLVLEEREAARKRGAEVLAEIVGYGNTTDASHMTRPDAEGEARAIRAALDDADLRDGEVDYINAHGTSTVAGDLAEARAIREVFRGRPGIPVSAVKSMTGHMLGASGAFEAACTAMSLHEGVILPTVNSAEPDPLCDINVVAELRHADLNVAVSNSFGFGGVNAVLALRRCDSH